jgi:hypothetical protein
MSLKFKGGDGRTVDDAIVVEGYTSKQQAIAAQYAWMADKYGKKFRDPKKVRHDMIQAGPRMFDALTVVVCGKGQITHYFDITDVFSDDVLEAMGGGFGGD